MPPTLSSRSLNDLAVPKRKERSRDSFLMAIVSAVVVAVLVGGQIVVSGVTEGYCIVWPSIGTAYAPGYSAAGFAKVEPGMTREKVVSLLGEPLGKRRGSWWAGPSESGNAGSKRNDEVWHYSHDSSALGGDWAWLSREVIFRDGVVLRTVSWTYHD
jgi:hypothetical protein